MKQSAPPSMNGRPALVAFDVDGTLVDDTVFVWDTLHDHFGTDVEERRAVQADYMAGRITYADWFDHDITSLMARGANRETMAVALGAMRRMTGAEETLDALVGAGVILAVVSGSLNIVLDRLFPSHPFSDVFINQLEFDADGGIHRWIPTRYDMVRKAAALRQLSEKHGVPLERCAFVGDHYNDVEAVRLAGLGIAFNCKSEDLAAAADIVVSSSDLRDVLPHLL